MHRLRTPFFAAHPFLITSRCSLRCPSYETCRGEAGSDAAPGASSQPLPDGNAPLVRLRGGDPFACGDVVGWAAWARRERPGARIEIEGPGHHLGRADVLKRVVE